MVVRKTDRYVRTIRCFNNTHSHRSAGRLVELVAEPAQGWGSDVAWECDLSPAAEGDVGAHFDRATGAWVQPNWQHRPAHAA